MELRVSSQRFLIGREWPREHDLESASDLGRLLPQLDRRVEQGPRTSANPPHPTRVHEGMVVGREPSVRDTDRLLRIEPVRHHLSVDPKARTKVVCNRPRHRDDGRRLCHDVAFEGGIEVALEPQRPRWP